MITGSNRDRFTKELKAPVNGTLCTNHAEWIVESFMTTKDHETLFPDFGELHFTDIKAISAANEEVSLQEHGIIVEAEPVRGNGKYLTDCEITGSDATTCKWLGYKGIFES